MPTFLKALGPVALVELRDIFIQSFRDSTCPQIWREVSIMSLLKAGKPANSIESFPPVSLTPCFRAHHNVAAYIIWLSLEDGCPAYNLDPENNAAVTYHI